VQRKTIETPPASVLGYEEIVERNKGWEGDTPSGKVGEKTAGKLMREIRWANLGWVYQVSPFAFI
jgi:alkylated DNA repair protein alkB family protein 1